MLHSVSLDQCHQSLGKFSASRFKHYTEYVADAAAARNPQNCSGVLLHTGVSTQCVLQPVTCQGLFLWLLPPLWCAMGSASVWENHAEKHGVQGTGVVAWQCCKHCVKR
jgi:hypothetical protein